MSFYIAPNGIDEDRLKAVALELKYEGKETVMHPGPLGWLWVDDNKDRFGPARDPETGTTVISSGRLAWSALEWARGASLPFTGGIANRLILERYLKAGATGVAPYNGAVAIAIFDPKEDQLHVWSDQFGYHPCFIYGENDPSQCIVTTFPDALLADKHVTLSDDFVSMAEFIRAWRITPPFTYFREVKHLGAATRLSIDIRYSRFERQIYWTPFEEDFYPSINEAAEDLAAAVRASIIERTAIAERPLVFISGGADSRVLLFNAENPSRVLGVNLYERPAKERDVAQALCEAAGCGFKSFQRDNDFYPRNLSLTARWSGGMGSSQDSHYLGFWDQIRDYSPDLVLTACTTDWLFKGYGLEKAHITVLGKNLPIYKYCENTKFEFLPDLPSPTPPQYESEIRARLSAWFAGCPDRLTTAHQRLLVEDRRVRPTAYATSVSGPVMFRTFPYDAYLADSRIAVCYSRTHPDWKLNKSLWGKVAMRLTSVGDRIVDSNYGWHLDASTAEKLFVFAKGWFGRKLKRTASVRPADDQRPASTGSWPDPGWYALHSPTLMALWNSVTTEERQRLAMISATDPMSKSLAEWSNDASHLFRLLTLLSTWRESEGRRKRAHTPY